jgi:hypothetical protein
VSEFAIGLLVLAPLALFGLVLWHFPNVAIVWLGVLLVMGIGAVVRE